MPETRQLAAILFSDISGFTNTMEGDETRAMAHVQKHRKIVTKTISEFKGELLKEMGDGMLLKFTSAIEAVRCATHIQTQAITEDFNLRIGIHLGDVIIKDDDVFGSGVNIASRIHEHGTPGSICISNEIWLQIKNQTDINTKSLGNKKLKGVDGEIEIYQLDVVDSKTDNKTNESNKNSSSPTVDKKWSLTKKILFPVTGFILMILGGLFWFIYPFLTIGMGHEKDYDASIAILYMENMSTDENSYFADGLTEELINRISRIQNIKVRPRTDVATFKNKTATMNEISEKLQVNYIVEGAVKIVDDNLRVNVSLFDIAQYDIIWSDSYDKKLIDIFAVQDEISSQIVAKLDETLTISTNDIYASKRESTENIEAYKLINQCYDILNDSQQDSRVLAEKAIPLAEKAILLDSTYADAYATLALSLFFKHDNSDASDEAIKDANEAILLAEKALFYDPDNELALAETILIPAFQMRAKKWDEGKLGDLFLIRQLTIKMDHALRKFPDSPFILAMGAMYHSIKYHITEDTNNLTRCLPLALKAHSIIINNWELNNDFLIRGAQDIIFELIPFAYSMLEKSEKAAEFIRNNKNMICEDGTFKCLGFWRLKQYSQLFYDSFNYDESLDIINIILNRSDEDFEYEGVSPDKKETMYWRSGMIHMKLAKYEKAIKGFKNALKMNDVKVNLWWNVQYNKRLGLVYYLMKNYDNASPYYARAYHDSKKNDYTMETIESLCFHAYIEELLGNSQIALEEITECSELVKQNHDDLHSNHNVLETYWPLYMFYNLNNNSINSHKYLKLAYDIVDKEKIANYHLHPEKDTHPEFFYCRDIIKTYENTYKTSLNK